MTTRAAKSSGTGSKGDPQAPAPNLKFIGKDEELDKLDAKGVAHVLEAEPLTKINDGENVITLPSVEEQRTGSPFYHPDAATIARLYPGLYKVSVEKGGK
jgi:hypothetical protein